VAVGSILHGLTDAERSDLDLRIYISNTKPEEHPLNRSFLHNLVQESNSPQTLASPRLFRKLQALETNHQYEQKTAWDFSLALERCFHNSTAPYIALFEDDIVVAHGWLSRTRIALRDAQKIAFRKAQDYLDLRLFIDTKELYFLAPWFWGSSIPIPLVWTLIIITAGPLLYAVLQYLRRRSRRNFLSDNAVFAICSFTVPLVIVLFLQHPPARVFGGQNGVAIQPWGVCTQGEIFKRDQIPHLVAKLRERAHVLPADMIVWQHAREHKLLRFAVEPVQVQHLGFKSLLHPERSLKEAVWSTSFERLNPLVLSKEHEEMEQQVFPEVT